MKEIQVNKLISDNKTVLLYKIPSCVLPFKNYLLGLFRDLHDVYYQGLLS